MLCWAEYNYTKPDDITHPEKEKLWFNSNIKRANQVIYIAHLFQSNLVDVGDIMENGEFLDFRRFQEKFQCNITFLDYYGIIRAITEKLKFSAHEHATDGKIDKIDKIKKSESVTKIVYNDMNEGKFPHKAYEKIQQMLQIEISEEDFLNYFLLIYQSNKFTKLQEFQYKVLTTSVITNITLKQWGILNTDLCTFCGQETETLCHLLWECNRSKEVWSFLQNEIRQIAGCGIRFSPSEIILGVRNNIPLKNIINFIFIVTKYYLYASRCLKINPTGQMAIQKIRNCREIELEIAIQNNDLEKFTTRWDQLVNL